MKKITNNNIQPIKISACSSFKLILIIVFLGATNWLSAAEWERDYGVGATLHYIDNIGLAGPGLEQADTALETTPYISAQAVSGRTNLDLYYQLQAINYAENDDANTVYHQLYADMNMELFKEFLFMDVRATNSQNIISTAGKVPVDNVSISTNRTDVSTFSVSPYISKNYSGNIKMLLRVTFNKTKYDDEFVTNIGSDVENKIYNFALSNAAKSHFSWQLDLNRDEFSTNVVSKNYYEVKSMTVSYGESSQLRPYAVVGDEDNSIYQSTMNSGGGFWSVGLKWNPTPRTAISASGGQRFYGDSKTFAWETQGRRLKLVIDYNEAVTSSSTLFNRQSLGQVEGDGSSNDFIDITDTVFVSKKYSSSINYKKSKTTISWRVFNEERSFVSSGEVQKYQGSNLSLALRVGARTTVKMNANWFRNKSESELSNNIIGFALSGLRNISDKISGEIGYRYRDNEVDGPTVGYVQNVVFANLTASFK